MKEQMWKSYFCSFCIMNNLSQTKKEKNSMGLFDKKECSICGAKIGLLGNKKLKDEGLER